MRRKIVCVLNKSPEYQSEYVGRLFSGISDHLDSFEFVAIQSKWPGWWSKLEIFSPDVTGDFLYLDLDTIIVGPIDDLFTAGKLTVLADFNLPKPDFMATGVMFVTEHERACVWAEWIRDPQGHMARHGGNGDGGFLSQFWKKKAARWQDLMPGKIVSYKLHCRNGVPKDASVVCFHGKPKPKDVGWKLARCG